MPPKLSLQQENIVNGRRKDIRPSVYNPKGTAATEISQDFEAWLILTSNSLKSKLLSWLDQVLNGTADKDFEDLLKETITAEHTWLQTEASDLSPTISALENWLSDPGISGWQDVAELAWLSQEMQSALQPHQDATENFYRDSLRGAVWDRYPKSADSIADVKTRVSAWVAALNAY